MRPLVRREQHRPASELNAQLAFGGACRDRGRGGGDEMTASSGIPAVPFDPADVIPHRAPFLLVDSVTSVVPGERATGLWHLAPDAWFFAGHFPGRPTLPGVLMIESLAQLGAVAALLDDRFAGKLALFGGIERARFRRQVVPGETLELSVELSRMSRHGGRGIGTATVDGSVATEGSLLFVVVDSEVAS
jgi:3-hydroxyacyl-[acyl-carrier-protein] dehydratase